MSTPAAPSNASASAGVTLNEWVSVDLTVTPKASGDIVCDMTCNGRDVTVTFAAGGDVDLDVHEEPEAAPPS